MRITFIGCVEFSHSLLEVVLALPSADVVGVVTLRRSDYNADFRSLGPMAEAHGIDVLYADDSVDTVPAWLATRRPDVVYCFGWPRLLDAATLSVAPLGTIGSHPTALPQNRGHHPIIWALVLGLTRTASTFFFMDEGVDSGDILDQREIDIYPQDDSASLYARITATAIQQVADFTPRLAAGTADRRPQDAQRANTWRKRGAADGEIDWRMSSRSIHNLVRALARPYVGAHTNVAGRPVKIWRAEPVDVPQVDHIEPGKVLTVAAPTIVVKCGEGAIRILDHEFDPIPAVGRYLR